MEKDTLVANRYRLKEFLGSGSFGEVWLAEDTSLDMEVAVKIYITLDPNGQNEFSQEYKIAYGLNHQNLLKADYYSIWDHHPFLVMKYCAQGSAAKKLGQLDERQIWTFIHDVASGLTFLHSQTPPVIHQDIKPENILVDDHGHFLITDFGISKKLRSTMRKQSKRVVGTGALAYMGPERFLENPIAVKASDIWSLGVSIYELCTGELPFSGHGGAMLNYGAELPRLNSSKWSENLNDVMQRCLSKETWDRPTAADLMEYSDMILKGKNLSFEQFKEYKQTGMMPPAGGYAPSGAGESTVISEPEDTVIGGAPDGGDTFPPIPGTPQKPDEPAQSDPIPSPLSKHGKRPSWLIPLFCFLGMAIVVFIGIWWFTRPDGGESGEVPVERYVDLTSLCRNNIDLGSAESYSPLLEAGVLLDSIQIYEEKYPELKENPASKTEELKADYGRKSREAAAQWVVAGREQENSVGDYSAALQYYQLAVLFDPSEQNKGLVSSIAENKGAKGALMAVRDAKIADGKLTLNYFGICQSDLRNVPVDYVIVAGGKEVKGHSEVTLNPGKGRQLSIKLPELPGAAESVTLSSGGLDFFSQTMN